MDTNLGKKLNGYKLLSLLGEGGMAQVYYAENALKRPAAVKILKPQFAFEPGIRQRFQQEAETMVKLDHPHIRSVIDYVEEDLAIIMEFLSGTDLKDYLDKLGSVPEATIRHWLTQLLPALQYAHDKGVVHRDIKPSNIFLTTDGQIKLMDFGIAKLAGEIGQTHTGQIIGSPLYMSPEQITNPKEIDWRSDMYSLGVTLYHLLSGQKPYDDSTASLFTLQMKIVQEPLPSLKTPSMDLLVQRLTEKKREFRNLNSEEIYQELSQSLKPEIIPIIKANPEYQNDETFFTDENLLIHNEFEKEKENELNSKTSTFNIKRFLLYTLFMCPSSTTFFYNMGFKGTIVLFLGLLISISIPVILFNRGMKRQVKHYSLHGISFFFTSVILYIFYYITREEVISIFIVPIVVSLVLNLFPLGKIYSITKLQSSYLSIIFFIHFGGLLQTLGVHWETWCYGNFFRLECAWFIWLCCIAFIALINWTYRKNSSSSQN